MLQKTGIVIRDRCTCLFELPIVYPCVSEREISIKLLLLNKIVKHVSEPQKSIFFCKKNVQQSKKISQKGEIKLG